MSLQILTFMMYISHNFLDTNYYWLVYLFIRPQFSPNGLYSALPILCLFIDICFIFPQGKMNIFHSLLLAVFSRNSHCFSPPPSSARLSFSRHPSSSSFLSARRATVQRGGLPQPAIIPHHMQRMLNGTEESGIKRRTPGN